MAETNRIIVRSGSTVRDTIQLLTEYVNGGLDPETAIVGYDEGLANKLSTEPIMLDLDAMMPRVIAWVTLGTTRYPLYHPQSLPPSELVALLEAQSRVDQMTEEEKTEFLDGKIEALSITRTWDETGRMQKKPGLTADMVRELPYEAKARLYLAVTGVEVRSASPALDAHIAKHTEPEANPPVDQSL